MNENAIPMTAAPAASIPEDVLIILPATDAVLFPGVVLPIAVQGKRGTRRRTGSGAHATQGGSPSTVDGEREP
jgi:hypothetical protein